MNKVNLIFGVLITFLLMGCVSSSETPAPSTQSIETPSAAPSVASVAAATIGSPFNIGDLQITVSNLRQANYLGDGYFLKEARNGAKYVIFNAIVKNNGKSSELFSSSDIQAHDDQARKFDVALYYYSNERNFESIEPGLTAEYFDFYIEVPQEVSSLKLTFLENMFDSSGTDLILDLSQIPVDALEEVEEYDEFA